MNWNKNTVRTGAIVILAALVLRMLCSGLLGSVLEVFAQPELKASLLIYGESGRPVDPDGTAGSTQSTEPSHSEPSLPTDSSNTTDPTVTEPTGTEPPVTVPPVTDPPQTQPTAPEDAMVFSETDLQYVSLNSTCSYKPTLDDLLTQTLSWDLTGDAPTILIYHTHATEAFTPTPGKTYQETGGVYRTLDDHLNMVSIGDELTRLLEAAGLKVIHDRTLHDNQDYLDAYENSRKAVKEYLDQYPSIKLVLDLHRDAATYADGTQWATSATVNGEECAQLMMVVGSNATGLTHPNWKTNLATAAKLSVTLEKIAPGVTRPINLRGKRYNQDLCPASLIVEVGAAGNTHDDAMKVMSVLAEAIVELAKGANY